MTDKERQDSRILLQFIAERNFVLECQEILYVIDIRLHPQLDHIRFNVGSSEYEMWDKEGCYFKFTALNYDEKRDNYKYLRSLKK